MKIIQIIENSMILGIAYTACYKMSSRNERACGVESLRKRRENRKTTVQRTTLGGTLYIRAGERTF